MKKFMYLVPLAAVALASCSNDESVSRPVKADAVVLNPVVQGATRGIVYSDDNLFSEFTVMANGLFATSPTASGSEIASNEYTATVKQDGDNWKIEYGSEKKSLYWGDDDTPASFTAYAGNGTATAAAGKLNFTVDNDPAKQTDLVVAYNKGNKTAFGAGVPLHFRHTLSQVMVKASYNTNTADEYSSKPAVSVKVKKVKFAKLCNNSNLTLPIASTAKGQTYEAAWSNPTGAQDFETAEKELTLGATATFIDNSDAAGPMLLMPQKKSALTDWTYVGESSDDQTYLAVYCDIDYVTQPTGASSKELYPNTASSYDWVYVPVNIDWKPGYKYTYTLNFSNIGCGKDKNGEDIIKGILKPVTFLVTVEEEWIDGGEQTPVL